MQATLAATLAVAICMTALAQAASPARPAGSAEDRARHLAGQAPHRRDLTPLLLRLIRAYPSLGPAGQARANRVLARPTDNPDPDGNRWHAPEAAASPACTPHFCVPWVEKTADRPSLKDLN